MITPFGKTVRRLRMDKGLRLLDVANRLGKTPSYVSAVETGKRTVTDGFAKAVATAMGLSPSETEEVMRAAIRTRADVTLSFDQLGSEERELVAAFARRVNAQGLNDDDIAKLREIVFKTAPTFKMAGDPTPYGRRERGFLVPPMKAERIRTLAEAVRSTFVAPGTAEFPIMDVLEFRLQRLMPDFVLECGSREEMGSDEGRTIHGKSTIVLRDDVYENAWQGKGRDRFTACHELAHYVMHANVAFTRMETSESYPIYRDSEWQADTFAATLLVPPNVAKQFAGPLDLAIACKVTPRAAGVILHKYREMLH
jgi:transcriptional regulator with XRE-family HTH domain